MTTLDSNADVSGNAVRPDEAEIDNSSPKVPATTPVKVHATKVLDRVQPADESHAKGREEDSVPPLAAAPEVPVTIVTGATGMWRVQWTDAVGRLRQSWSPVRLDHSTLEHLESLLPHGDDIESILVEIRIPVRVQVATLHFMNIWEKQQITYQVMRDMLASQAGHAFIALEARVQALNASKP